MRRRIAVLLVVLAVGAACSSDDERPADQEGERKDLSLWLSRPHEPYPYTTPIPELEPTAVDGIYVRKTSVEEAGGYPVACRRCSPYRIEAGTSKLVLEQGRLLIRHRPVQPPSTCDDCKAPEGFTNVTHFLVDGETIELFNDANCSKERGTYSLTLEDDRLTFKVVSDDCPFGQLRARYLTDHPWTIRS